MLPSLRYTYDFVRSSLPEKASRIVEVGCGSGELAALLIADGLQVTAIDADAECVAKARELGVDAQRMSWPMALDGTFDAVLFTRSLHHVDDLTGGIAAAVHILNTGGRIIVEDFCAEGGSARSARWFEAHVRNLYAKGAMAPGSTVEALLEQAAPSSSHDHHLHASSSVRRALAEFGTVFERDSAYYFRYLEPHLSAPGAADDQLRLEAELLAKGSIDALGKRFLVVRS